MKLLYSIFFILVFFNSGLFAFWSQSKCNNLATDGYFKSLGPPSSYFNSSYNMGIVSGSIGIFSTFYNCDDFNSPLTSYTIYSNNSSNVVTNFDGVRESFVFVLSVPCKPPVGLNDLGIFPDLSTCNNALQILSKNSSSSSLACTSCSTDGTVTLYASPDLKCTNGGTLKQNSNGISSCVASSFCDGSVFSPLTIQGVSYSKLSDYTYFGSTDVVSCSSKLSEPNVDSITVQPDSSSSCEKSYCYYHEIISDCNFSPLSYSPSPRSEWSYVDVKSDSVCSSFVDGVYYDSNLFVVPDSVMCPNTGLCFLHNISVSSNSEDLNGSNMNNSIDLNNTSLSNKALLDSANTSNKHLKDLKKKSDLSNKLLKDLNNKSVSIKSSLDKLDLNNQKSMREQLSQLRLNGLNSELSNDKLNRIAFNTGLSSDSLRAISSDTASINSNIKSGLFGSNPFVGVDFTDDGSSTFDVLGTQASDSFSVTTNYDIFGLASVSSVGLQTYSANFHGTSVIFFQPSMLDAFPIVEIRSLILFIFALTGFAHTFRSV